MKNNEEMFKNIVGIFAIIGLLSTVVFVVNLFNNEDADNICGAYLGKIDELESEIINLEDKIDALENENYELEQDVEEWKEEYNSLENSKGCSSKGSAKLTNGSSKEK